MRLTVCALLALCLAPWAVRAQSPSPATRAGVDAFNRALEDATRSMSNAGILALSR